MTSSNGNIFRVTGPLCGEFTGDLWIPLTKTSDAELWCFRWSTNGWINTRDAGDLRHHRAHYDANLMVFRAFSLLWSYDCHSKQPGNLRITKQHKQPIENSQQNHNKTKQTKQFGYFMWYTINCYLSIFQWSHRIYKQIPYDLQITMSRLLQSYRRRKLR